MARLVERLSAVAFDLDGTLVHSLPDLAAAANAMLAALHRPALREDEVAAMVGDGLDTLVERALAATGATPPVATTLAAARTMVRQRYAASLFNESRVYPGVVEGLRALRDRGLPLACITNKASDFTLPLLDAAGLAPFFALALCADRPEQRKPRPDLLLAVCAQFATPPAALLYVGDGTADLGAARAAGCPMAGVDYGYGDPVELAKCDWLIGSLTDIAALRDDRRVAATRA